MEGERERREGGVAKGGGWNKRERVWREKAEEMEG